jgi:hypothetical protein
MFEHAWYSSRRAGAIFAALSAGCLALAAVWANWPQWFLAKLFIPYPDEMPRVYFARAVFAFPHLLLILAAAAALLATAFFLAERPVGARLPPLPALSPLAEGLALGGLIAIGAFLSLRLWVYWQRPAYDYFLDAGGALHNYLHTGGPAARAALLGFMGAYHHAACPLTPMLLALGMFLPVNPVVLLQTYNLAATVGAALALRAIVRRLAPEAPAWPICALYLTNAAVARNSFFTHIEGLNALLGLLAFRAWLRWRDEPTRARLAALAALLTAAVFQKVSLLPLLAIPTATGLYEAWREKRRPARALWAVAFWTGAAPLLNWAAYGLGFGLFHNLAHHIVLMGTGWNRFDFAPLPFFYSTAFLLGPYAVAVAANGRLRAPVNFGFLLFIGLFFAAIFAVRGPFWGRYYSNVVGPCLALAAPGLARAGGNPRVRAPLYAFYVGTVAVQWGIIYLYLIR